VAFRPRGWDEKPACTAKCLKNGVIGNFSSFRIGMSLGSYRKLDFAGTAGTLRIDGDMSAGPK